MTCESIANILSQLVIGFFASAFVLVLALIVERRRLPNLRLTVSADDHHEITSTGKPGELSAGRWKFLRIRVENREFPRLLRWIVRQTAEQCTAQVHFQSKSGTPTQFSMKGRWAGTPELGFYAHQFQLKVLYPDPVIIPAGCSEVLDIVSKYEKVNEAHGWNNESYLHQGLPKAHELVPGDYVVTVSIFTQNGVSFRRQFELTVGTTLETTQLHETT